MSYHTTQWFSAVRSVSVLNVGKINISLFASGISHETGFLLPAAIGPDDECSSTICPTGYTDRAAEAGLSLEKLSDTIFDFMVSVL